MEAQARGLKRVRLRDSSREAASRRLTSWLQQTVIVILSIVRAWPRSRAVNFMDVVYLSGYALVSVFADADFKDRPSTRLLEGTP